MISWVDSFYTSLFNAGVEVAKYFIKNNFKRVAYIGEKESDKLKGFLSEINRENHLNSTESNILFTLEKGFRKKIPEKIKKLDLKCDAIFFSSDEIALLFIKEARKYNINLYEKEMVGFDNTIISQTLGITSIEQPMENMCELAMKVLLERIEKKNKTSKIFNTELEPKLIIRK